MSDSSAYRARAAGGERRDYGALVDQLFCRPKSPYTGFERHGSPEVLVDNLLVMARLRRKDVNYDITLFDGVSEVAGELWERSAKAMLRLRSLGHPALPAIVAAKQMSGERVAFTITQTRGEPLALSEAVAWASKNPLAAFEQYSLLLDALKRLHGSRLMHRLMLPSAFRWFRAGGRDGVQLCLGRFEMSALISNVIRRVVGGASSEVRENVRQLYLTPAGGASLQSLAGARHMAYLAPEIHPYLFDDEHRSRRDWDTTDLFGLGVLGWELFCGGLPQRLPSELQAVADASQGDRVAALSQLHSAMRKVLRGEPDLPPPLRDAISNMLESEPARRESSFHLARRIDTSWEQIHGVWEEPSHQPYLVAFMPEESADTMYVERRWISRNPKEAAGREELRAFLEEELEEAYLVHSLTGAEGYATGPTDVLKEAEWVLIGKRAVWFCAFLRETAPDGSEKAVHKNALVIKYLREHGYAKELYVAHPRRRVPAVDVIPFFPPESLADQREGRPTWEPLTESVDRTRHRDPENEKFLQSLDFLLDYQRAELDSRIYPYILEDGDDLYATLRYDAVRDDAWRQRTPLMAAYAGDPRRRPPLARFVEGLDSSDGWIDLSLDGRVERPGFTGQSPTVQFAGRKDDDSITVRLQASTRVPPIGWLRPTTDGGSRPQLARQLRARQALDNQPALVSELRAPMPMEIGQQQWDVDPEKQLEGNAEEVITAMLSSLPLYALQGPPGSGKTHAVVNALRLYLKSERGAKVLVSAQSNFALDNLAERLVKALPKGTIVLREVGRRAGADRVSTAIQQLTIESITEDRVARVRKTLEARLERQANGGVDKSHSRPLTSAEIQISADWLQTVEADRVELADRLRSGASVVLATCSVAGTTLDDAVDITESFDWVIVEEAAKAWPTELIIPMTMGTRWTLVGDHQQLGAHRGEDVGHFLASLKDYEDPLIKPHYEAREKRIQALELFRTLFRPRDEDADSLRARMFGGSGEGLGRLQIQYRMHPSIAEPVRRVFYPVNPPRFDETGFPVSFLESHPRTNRPHEVVNPAYLQGTALVWLDTGSHPACFDEPMWFNYGEVELVEKLVSDMEPPPAPVGHEGPASLAILTPYRAQVDLLQARSVMSGRVFTVHSFQGREADRVIVSLVRTTRVSDDPERNVGHVGRDEVANVLLSRAKRLLVLVGRFEHFRDCGGPAWHTITRLVEAFGTVVRPEEWVSR